MASDGNDRNAGSNAHSNPIAIITHPRRRSASVSSISSGSSLEPQTPASWNPARIATASPSSSPILSYFLGQSPTAKCHPNPLVIKSKFDTSTVPEEDVFDHDAPVVSHARRASTAFAGRISQPSQASSPLMDERNERGQGLLRRISIGTLFRPPNEASPPQPPPNSAASPTENPLQREPSPILAGRKPKRSATVGDGARPRRAPSPMGERILKGHFDGFN